MPLDINSFRVLQGGNPDIIRNSQRRRFASVELVDEIITKDDLWRFQTGAIDDMRKERNKVQKDVATKKKAKEQCDDEVAQIKKFDQEILDAEARQKELRVEIDKMVSRVGNIVEDGVPTSNDEDKDNLVIKKWGTPRDPKGLLNHHDLLWRIGGYEPERGSAVAGHKGYFLRDVGVLLNQAFINYGISFLRKRQYTVVQPPYFMKKEVMAGVAQLEEFDEALYKVSGDGAEEKYLIATSEQPLCGYHKDEWMDEKALPLRYAGVSTCFRKEAGSSGRDVWGIFRVHQFEKVEQFVIVEGDIEKSKAMQEEMILAAEEFYQSLGFPYHVINIVSGALNNAAIKKYDLECWFPGYNSYRELVSCSNCTDYQSRSMEIRCGGKKLGEREKKYVHMLNATLCATGRAICCLLETYQDTDGVHVPEVLVPFMDGITFLPFVRDAKDAPKVDGEKKPALSTTTTTSHVDSTPVAVTSPTPVAVVAPSQPVKIPTATTAVTVTTPTPTPAVVDESLTPEAQSVATKIAAKGDEIRNLKTAKASKEDIAVRVAQLLELKNEFKAITGKDFGAPAGPVDSKSKPADADKKSDKKPEKEAKPAASKPAAANKPTAVSIAAAPKPAAVVTPPVVKKTPSLEQVVKADNKSVDLQALDDRLLAFSYVGGFAPSKHDSRYVFRCYNRVIVRHIFNLWFYFMYRILGLFPNGKEVDAKHKNVNRWLRHIQSFSPEELASWV